MIPCRSRSTFVLHLSWAALGTMIILALTVLQAEAADVVTVESLLRKMADTRWLAQAPQAGERTVQFSSYDRASRLEDGKMIHPFANGDRGHYLRVEGEGRPEGMGPGRGQGPRLRVADLECQSRRRAADLHRRRHDSGPGRPVRGDHQRRDQAVRGTLRPRRLARPQPLFPVPVREVDQDHARQGGPVFPGEPSRRCPPGTKVESYSPEVLKRAGPVDRGDPPATDPSMLDLASLRGDGHVGERPARCRRASRPT